MPRLNLSHLFIFIALSAVLLLPCYTFFFVTPLYNGFIVSETDKVVKNIASQLTVQFANIDKINNDNPHPDFVSKILYTSNEPGLFSFTIYSPAGIIAYASNVSEIGKKTTKNDFGKLLSGGTTHNPINRKKQVTSDGKTKEIDLVESYAPIVVNGKTIGLLEIYHDITESKKNLAALTHRAWLIPYLISIILALLIIFLSVKTRRNRIKAKIAEKQLYNYSSRLKILRKIYASILATQTPEAIAKIAVDHLTKEMSYNSVRIYSYDFDRNKGFLLAARDRDNKTLPEFQTEVDILELEKLLRGKPFIQEPSSNQRKSQSQLNTVKAPLITEQGLIGALEIQCDSKIAIDNEVFQVINEISSPLAIAIQNSQLYTLVDKQKHQLRTLSKCLSEMEDAERGKISVELHDRVGQNLTALNINLNIIKSRIGGGMIEGAEICITESFLLIEETTEQIRDIMSELRPHNLDDHGLLAAVNWYASQRTRRSGLKIEVIGNNSESRPALDLEMVFFRIAQEALNNVIKHAKAHAATIKILNDGLKLIMTISDDGIGFETKRRNNHLKKPSGLGIISMQERISAVGGSFKVESTRGHGTTITVEVEI